MAGFRFTHEWSLAAGPDRVYAVLADVERYAAWWPQVRGVTRVDDQSGRAAVRSTLPYTLHLLLTRDVADEENRRLRVTLDGDLKGWSQWLLEPAGRGRTLAHYTQEVDVTPRLLRWGSRVARPLLVANHTRMMVAGRRGLTAYLGR